MNIQFLDDITIPPDDMAYEHQVRQLLYQDKTLRHVPAAYLELLLADGWRHFGNFFFRSMIGSLTGSGDYALQTALRINLADYKISKNDKRTIRKNSDTTIKVRLLHSTRQYEALYRKHSQKFPDKDTYSISEVLGKSNEGKFPTPCYVCEVFSPEKKMIAASFIDITQHSLSSIYAIYDTELTERRLGIYTLLAELEIAKMTHKKYLYLGYAHFQSSSYDYKKKFSGLELYDWVGTWHKAQESNNGELTIVQKQEPEA